jgi:hypothetical protein
LERSSNVLYAIFFISSNLYGLDKIVESKWALNPTTGRGYNHNKNPNQITLFDFTTDENTYYNEISVLEDLLLEELIFTETMNNMQLYEFVLQNEYMPKHANEAIANLLKKNKIILHGNINKTGISWDNYKNFKIVSEIKLS